MGNKLGFILICILIVAIAIFGLFSTLNAKNNNIENTNLTNNENTATKQNSLNDIQQNLVIVSQKELGSFSTNIYDDSENRVNNIKIACDTLNGYVLEPEKSFSFNEIIGPYSEDKGYLESYGLNNEGKRIKVIGGGVCQVSSTLYNLALNLNFEIVERHQHSANVGYIELGKDATISYGRLDLKFINTSSYNVKFTATCENNTVTITATAENMLPQS